MSVGISLFLIYLVLLAYWTSRKFFGGEEFALFLGIFTSLSWLVVGEGLLAIFNVLVLPLVILPYSIPVLFVAFDELSGSAKMAPPRIRFPSLDVHALPSKIPLILFSVTVLATYATLLQSRTGEPFFSVLQVVPVYYWIELFVLVALCSGILLKQDSGDHAKRALLMVCLVAFAILGSYFLASAYGWDADPYGILSSIKIDFLFGFRNELWRIVPNERGLEALTASIAILSGPKLQLDPTRIFLYGFTPVLASLSFPLFSYLFVRKLIPNSEPRLAALASLSFMLVPSLLYFVISDNIWLACILMIADIFVLTSYFDSKKKPLTTSGIWLLLFLATAVIHPWPAVFALMAFLLVLFVRGNLTKPFPARARSLAKSRRRPLELLIATAVVSLIPSAVLLGGGQLLGLVSATGMTPLAQLQFSQVLNHLSNFFQPAWLVFPVTISNVIGQGLNWLRLSFLLIGIALLYISKSSSGHLRQWFAASAGSAFLASLIIYSFFGSQLFPPVRFLVIVDIIFMPLVSVGLYYCFQRIARFVARLPLASARRFFTATCAVLIALMFLVPTSLMLNLPMLPPVSPNQVALPGRPTSRAVSSEEIAALNMIVHSNTSYAVVTSDSFLLDVAQAELEFRSFDGYNNIFVSSTLIQDALAGNVEELSVLGRLTNSTTVYLFFNDYFLNESGTQITQVTSDFRSLALVGIHSYIFGNLYHAYVVEARMSVISPVSAVHDQLGNLGIAKGSVLQVTGSEGPSFYFNGGNNSLEVQTKQVLNFSQGITIGAWVYLATNQSYVNTVFSKWYDGGAPSQDAFILAMYPTINQTYFYVSNGKDISHVNVTRCPTNQWVQILATYDGGTMNLYLNGTLVASSAGLGQINATTIPLYIGAEYVGPQPQYFTGLISDAFVLQRAITAGEVSALWSGQESVSSLSPVVWFLPSG